MSKNSSNNLPDEKYYALQTAILNEEVDVNELDEHGNTPLHYLVFNSDIRTIKLLLNTGSEFNIKNKDGFTPVQLATHLNNFEIVRILLEHESIVAAPILPTGSNQCDSEGNTLLHLSVAAKPIESFYENMVQFLDDKKKIIELLIQKNADIDAKNEDGITPLSTAVINKDLFLIRTLLNNGAKVNTQEGEDKSCLLCAADTTPDIVAILLAQKDINVNAKDNLGRSPLLVAVGTDNIKIAELLINANAEVDITNNNGTTPLHNAALKGNMNMVELLVGYNADCNIKNKEPATPIDFAKEGQHTEIIAFLEETLKANTNGEITEVIEEIAEITLESSDDVESLGDNTESLGDIT